MVSAGEANLRPRMGKEEQKLRCLKAESLLDRRIGQRSKALTIEPPLVHVLGGPDESNPGLRQQFFEGRIRILRGSSLEGAPQLKRRPDRTVHDEG